MSILRAPSGDFTKQVLGDVKGDAIVSIGTGGAEVLPIITGVGVKNVDQFVNDIAEPDVHTLNILAGGTVATDGTITLSPNENHDFETGDRILYENNTSTNFIVGLVDGKHYFAINNGTTTSFKLAVSRANALADEPIEFGSSSIYGNNSHTFKNLSSEKANQEFRLSIANPLFDFGIDNPTSLTLNFLPGHAADNNNRFFVASNGLKVVPYWRRYSPLVSNDAFVPHKGTDWYDNQLDPVNVREHQVTNVRQQKVISLYGSTTTVPNGIGHLTTSGQDPYNGYMNHNNLVRHQVGGGLEAGGQDLIVGHIKDGTTLPSTELQLNTTVLPGNNNYWIQHEWFQNLHWDSTAIDDLFRTGKMKFGCKIRVPEEDRMRLNDFAGMYVKIVYPTNQDVTNYAEHIAYFKIQRRDSTHINLTTGDITLKNFNHTNADGTFTPRFGYSFTTAPVVTSNAYGSSLGVVREGARCGDLTGNPMRITSRYVEELKTVYVEDVENFTTVEAEFTLPDALGGITNNNHPLFANRLGISTGLFYADHCANLSGMAGGDSSDTASTQNFNNDISVGDRVFVRILPSSEADKITMGFETDGTRLLQPQTNGILIRKAGNSTDSSTEARRILNDTQVRADGLTADDPYFIDSLEGITQAEMHKLAGTAPSTDEIDALDMVVGRVYTISDLGVGNHNLSNVLFTDEINETPIAIGSNNHVVGHAFKYGGNINSGPSSSVKVVEGGYPRSTLFTARHTASSVGISSASTKGYFTRTSGSCQFYSPYVDYTFEEPSYQTNMAFSFGGTTIGSSPEPGFTGDLFEFPTGADSWGGFSNSNRHVYPFRFFKEVGGKGGTIQFDAYIASGTGDSRVYFKFNHNPHPDTSPNYTTAYVTVSGATKQTYTIDIPARTHTVLTSSTDNTDEFNEIVMYLMDRDKPVVIQNIRVTDYSKPQPTT